MQKHRGRYVGRSLERCRERVDCAAAGGAKEHRMVIIQVPVARRGRKCGGGGPQRGSSGKGLRRACLCRGRVVDEERKGRSKGQRRDPGSGSGCAFPSRGLHCHANCCQTDPAQAKYISFSTHQSPLLGRCSRRRARATEPLCPTPSPRAQRDRACSLQAASPRPSSFIPLAAMSIISLPLSFSRPATSLSTPESQSTGSRVSTRPGARSTALGWLG